MCGQVGGLTGAGVGAGGGGAQRAAPSGSQGRRRGAQAVRSAPTPSSFPLQPPTSHLCPPTGFSKNNKNIWHMVRGKRLRNLWAPRSGFRRRWRHAAAGPSLASRPRPGPGPRPDPEVAGRPDPAGMCTLPPCTPQCELHFTSCQEKVFLPPLLVARAAAGSERHLQEADHSSSATPAGGARTRLAGVRPSEQ